MRQKRYSERGSVADCVGVVQIQSNRRKIQQIGAFFFSAGRLGDSGEGRGRPFEFMHVWKPFSQTNQNQGLERELRTF